MSTVIKLKGLGTGPGDWEGELEVIGFASEQHARTVGRLFSKALAQHHGVQVDAYVGTSTESVKIDLSE